MPGSDAPGLYVHVPFCSAICPYCDFAVRRDDAGRRAAYVRSLQREVALWSGAEHGFGVFNTLYFGGGTPSLLEGRQLAAILDAIRDGLALAPGVRVFLEANPEDVDATSLRAWRELGVSFLSLGVQAFDDGALAFLGRRHSAEDARRAVALALEAGFETVSLDLIYGLPDHQPSAWRRTLDQAAALGPQHLSCYQLTIEPATPFGKARRRGELKPLADDAQGELFLLTREHLARHGYAGYEVSNFARTPAHRSRHNRKYWQHVPYLGLGPSACSFDGRCRWWNERSLARWQHRLAAGERPLAGSETLSDAELALETLMLSLRTSGGVDLAAFQKRFGIDLEARNAARIARWHRDGLLEPVAGRLVLTHRGLAIADGLTSSLEITCPQPD
ncbi:MAG: radical SAM family heme chaperone HemW [Acidobacteria bacterium]|nr:MAG: radical SAM family heme chaperone HemW [Acidobacteriota bacterium]